MDEISESLMAMIDYAEATKKYADAGALRRVKDELERLRAQLAERESEAVGRVDLDGTGTVVGFLTGGNFKVGDKLYTTPQPPAVPDVMEYGDSPFAKQMADGYWCRGWNACIEAMLAASGEGE